MSGAMAKLDPTTVALTSRDGDGASAHAGSTACVTESIAPPGAARLTHLDEAGQARMVRVADKPETHRGAVARARVRMASAAWQQIRDGSGRKGDALQVARIAGIQASKQTAALIPLCHPVRLVSVEIDARLDEESCSVTLEARAEAAPASRWRR